MKTTDSTLIMSRRDPEKVTSEVIDIYKSMYPDATAEVATLQKCLADLAIVFDGGYPGYKACNTEYHDINHTCDCVLAMTRILHGAFLEELDLSAKETMIGICCAAYHDIGYLPKESEPDIGTGAQYTMQHIERGLEFINGYFPKLGLSEEEILDAEQILVCTDLSLRVTDIKFRGPRIKTLGQMLETADLVGQMSDRAYLEKLLFLFYEFQEAGIAGLTSKMDMLKNTIQFYNTTVDRLDKELDSQWKHTKAHFKAWHGIDENLYQVFMKKNREYLDVILADYSHPIETHLRRDGVVNQLKESGR